jgi:hypothetical protein
VGFSWLIQAASGAGMQLLGLFRIRSGIFWLSCQFLVLGSQFFESEVATRLMSVVGVLVPSNAQPEG